MLVQVGAINSVNPDADDFDLAIALEPPTRDVLETLRHKARNVLLLVRPFQVGFLHELLETARPLRLPSEADRAHDRAYRLRREIRDYIDKHALTDGFLALSPLFDEYDPTYVAAALAARVSQPERPEDPLDEYPAWIRVRVEAGKRQSLRTGDLVGALINAVEIPKNQVGKVDIRDHYSLVEIRAEAADRAMKGLNGLVLRGTKLTARPDRP
jgi:hypothetical protein